MAYESPATDDARIDVGALLSAIVRRLPRIILVTLALLVATFVVLMFQPRLYESTASILVEPRANAYARASGDAPTTPSGNAAGVVSSQIELIKSRDTLLGVIDELDLRSVPEFNGSQSGFSPISMIMQLVGRRAATPTSIDETVIGTLYERLSVVQERDSAIISVIVRSADPQLAADIANAIANAHVARRADLSISDTAQASGWLLDEIERLRSSVVEAEGAVADFKVTNDLFTGQNNTSLLDQQLSTIATQINEAQERKNAAQSRASLIRGLIDRGQPIEAVTDVQGSVIVQQLSQEKARVQGELAQRSATLLSSHPTIRALNAQVNELNAQIQAEGQRVAASLDAEAQIQADLEASLQSELARAKTSASTATRDTVTLDSLEREAKAQRDLLEAYLLRYNEASSRVEASSALPDVRVVSVAAPSVTPASPKTSLIMTAVALVSFLVQVGAIAFTELLSGRALAPVQRPRAQDELEEAPFDPDELEPEQRWEEPAAADAEDDIEAVPVPVAATPALLVEPVMVVPEPVAPAPQASADRVSDFIRTIMESKAQPEPEADEPEAAPEILAAAVDPEPEPVAEEPERTPVAAPVVAPRPRKQAGFIHYSDLVADLVLGRTHLLLLADHAQSQASQAMAEELVGDALGKGLSVALIDAGTGRRGDDYGITDLSADIASFGDVVQKSADNSFAEVVWGQGSRVNQQSSKPLTLVEALGDIYEVVVILTGPVGRHSTLSYFAELGGRIVLVAGDDRDADLAEEARRALEDAGLPGVEIAAMAEPVAA